MNTAMTRRGLELGRDKAGVVLSSGMHAAQDGFVGLRCEEARGRYLQARKRPPHRLRFFSEHWGVWGAVAGGAMHAVRGEGCCAGICRACRQAVPVAARGSGSRVSKGLAAMKAATPGSGAWAGSS